MPEDPRDEVPALDPLALALAEALSRGMRARLNGPAAADAALFRRRAWPLAQVEDTRVAAAVGDIPVRIYRPSPASGLPVLVYLHGGGWVDGDLGTVDENCRELAARVGCVVVSVDYTLSRVHKFPRALEEVDAVARWISGHADSFAGDPHRVAIGGESAGANLAAAACLLARDRGGPRYAFQLLVYPAVDADVTRAELQSARDPVLPLGLLRATWRHYMASPEDPRNPLFAPILAASLAALPPALIVTAETDPLRFEGRAYAEALTRAGVPTEHRHYAGLFHGFFGLPHPRAEAAMADVVAALRAALLG
jgi:acetyl esterase